MTHIIQIVDFETTDMDPPAEVIEVGACRLTGGEAGWTVSDPVSWLCGSAQPMGPAARAVHHISPAEIAGCAPFVAPDFWIAAKDSGVAVVAAHNLEFEAKCWGEPNLPVLCTYKAALRVFPDAPSHSNGALRYWLEDQGLIAPDHEKTMPAHRAGPDAYVTAWLLKALLVHATAAQMVAWTREPKAFPTCPIGDPWRGKKWADVDAGFLKWMIDKPVEADAVWCARRELDRRASA